MSAKNDFLGLLYASFILSASGIIDCCSLQQSVETYTHLATSHLVCETMVDPSVPIWLMQKRRVCVMHDASFVIFCRGNFSLFVYLNCTRQVCVRGN